MSRIFRLTGPSQQFRVIFVAQKVNAETQTLVDLVLKEPGSDGAFRALLILLQNSPDSSVIAGALGQIEPDSVGNADLRQDAAQLLQKADATELLPVWAPPSTEHANVFALTGAAPRFETRRTGITFGDIGGLEDVKKQVRRKIINPFQNKRALFERFKRKAGGGVLMYGPPGCGKTMLAKALASECQARFIEIKAADILDQFVGNAEKRISAVFQEARQTHPAVLFFDEVEALAQRRQFDSSKGVNTTVSALLNEMDGFAEDNDSLLFLGATNVPWSLDSAFRRPGRFDRAIFVPPPDQVAREFILKRLLEDRPVAAGLDLSTIIKESTGFSGADLSALVDTAIDVAIEDSPSVDALAPLSNEHFQEAFQEVRSTVGEWLGQAKNFAEYANENGTYDDLAAFLKKYAK